MDPSELAFCRQFDFEKWCHPSLSQSQFGQLSLYTKAALVTESNYPSFDDRDFEVSCPIILTHAAARTVNRLAFATQAMLHNVGFLFNVADAGAGVVFHATEALRDNKKFALKSAGADVNTLADCSQRLRDDKQIMLKHFAKRSTDLAPNL